MELLYASCVGVLVSCGVFLLLRARTFPVVLGTGTEYADPLPQALVLTAIVIGFAMTAFVVILAIRGRADLGSDHVDGYVPNTSADNKEQK